MIIVGAGLAGLIAGFVFPHATIIERSPEPQEAHKALLRFRSEEVSLITGIPFRRVQVHKGIWSKGKFAEPNIQLANLYAAKVAGGALLNRSIWNLEPVDRFIAPEDFYDILIQQRYRYIQWSADFSAAGRVGAAVISTMPLGDMAKIALLMKDEELPEFRRAPIWVERYRIPHADVHQTIYFPDAGTSTYRASITGDTLIVESMHSDGEVEWPRMSVFEILVAFGVPPRAAANLELIGGVKQSYGKISPINNRVRKELIHRLTTEAETYSVGRFATWRNILLDDVVKDLRIVKGMIEQRDAYSSFLKHTERATAEP